MNTSILPQKVLVTGGTGFIGSWLIKRLVADGHDVHVLVRKNSDLSELVGLNYKKVLGDVTDPVSLFLLFKNMHTVFHLAGFIAYRDSDKEKMQKINIDGTQNVVNACVQNHVPELVYLSSVVAIGAGFTPNEILNETSDYNISPLNLGYYQTKHRAEKIVIDAAQNKQIRAIILNPSTVYGPGDSKKGSRSVQLKVAQGKFKFYTSGGVNVVGIQDVINGIISAWAVAKSGERYILAGENITIQKLFSLIAKSAGVSEPKIGIPNSILFTLAVVGDLLNKFGFKSSFSRERYYSSTLFNWFDNSKAKQELGFNPGSAEEAIKASVNWSKSKGLI